MSKQTLTIQEIIKIINDLYEDRSGYVAYTPEQIKKYSKDKIQLTYGEILPESLNEIIKSPGCFLLIFRLFHITIKSQPVSCFIRLCIV